MPYEDAPGTDAPPDGATDAPGAPSDHVLLSEVASLDAEFIELWNPTTRTISLGDYYLADVGDYWRLPDGIGPFISSSDFLVRFPADARLAPGQVLTVALQAAAFQIRYSEPATYAVDATSGPQLMRERRVPATPSLNDGGELVTVFSWDGASDLVRDVDLVQAGRRAGGGDGLRVKQPVDGPDADTSATAYRPESGLLDDGMESSATSSTSYKRRALEVGSETQAGTGNGITGDDETSEQIRLTWDGDGSAPRTAPTPGSAPAI